VTAPESTRSVSPPSAPKARFQHDGPALATSVPGPRSRALAARLARVESRNVTCLVPEPPIFWERASGANVWDVDGNRFVDLTGAFGVANVGHAHPLVVEAIAVQSRDLLHGMGDVHPPRVKVELLEALAVLYPGGVEARGVLLSSGSDAVETALKTAQLASGRAGVVAFEGGYHGLAFGALDATWRDDFRAPFDARLAHACAHATYGDASDVERAASSLASRDIETGAVIVEPVQGRGGERVPSRGFLRALRALCDERGWLLIVDEIYTGFGRTGRIFACEHEDVVPDLLCIGKGMSSGMPIAACLGRASIMDAWPASAGEALHTQTFLGHPASCAAALASLRALREDGLVERSVAVGARALAHAHERLRACRNVVDVRGLGLMIGIECASGERALRACNEALARGFIFLPSGPGGRVVSITPPLCIDEAILLRAIDVLAALLA